MQLYICKNKSIIPFNDFYDKKDALETIPHNK